MIIDNEDFEAQKSNSYWAGRLIDLPKDDAWQIASEIVEAIEYALSQANGIYTSDKALPIADVGGSYLVKFVDPEKEYAVDYWIDNKGNKHREWATLKGKDLTENQIWQLFLRKAL